MAVKEQRAAFMDVGGDARSGAGYDANFFQWTQTTAEMIRQGRLAEVDLEHVAEEIEDIVDATVAKCDHNSAYCWYIF